MTEPDGGDPRERNEQPDRAADSSRDPRPAPAYGEYAPEGWTWKPEGAEDPAADADAQGTDATGAGTHSAGVYGANATGTGASGANTQPGRPNASGRVPGVPHNLGAKTDGRGAPATGTVSPPAPGPQAGSPQAGAQQPGPRQDPPPYRADEPQRQPAPAQGALPPGQKPQRSGGKIADLVITILLLAIGAYGALVFAGSFFQLVPELTRIAAVLGLNDFTPAPWVGTVATVGAIVILALYAVTLIYSIQRMRAVKLTFWVPLSAGVLAILIFFIVTIVVVTSSPELMERFADPSSMEKLMEFSLSQGG